ncbi:hypothetical protein L6452_22143 [Arctium lappa]|uniref:Uncharacterized protein n=1 Tax=Arctium lappa TaxID=4217 RepID=A0ACB9B0N4_ARCLA|nr:hypothetical protein L6452_22143 [Arctium lappa]
MIYTTLSFEGLMIGSRMGSSEKGCKSKAQSSSSGFIPLIASKELFMSFSVLGGGDLLIFRGSVAIALPLSFVDGFGVAWIFGGEAGLVVVVWISGGEAAEAC